MDCSLDRTWKVNSFLGFPPHVSLAHFALTMALVLAELPLRTDYPDVRLTSVFRFVAFPKVFQSL
jgi:hypothetical protein